MLTQIFGAAPALTRSGATVPIVDVFAEILGVGPVTLGFGLPGSRAPTRPTSWSAPRGSRDLTARLRGILRRSRRLNQYLGIRRTGR